jgi:hypothetical protein
MKIDSILATILPFASLAFAAAFHSGSAPKALKLALAASRLLCSST